MGGAVQPLAQIADVATLGSVSLATGGSVGLAAGPTGGGIAGAAGLTGGNPTGNPALGIAGPMTPSKSLLGMTAEDEQLSRNRAQVAASALAATNLNTKYRASSSLLGPSGGETTTTTGGS
jgi:hypothetical protein